MKAKKTIKLDIGTIYQKNGSDCYYFRYQINGQRKAVSLKTNNKEEAITKAKELLPIIKANTTEIISAHVKYAKGLTAPKRSLELRDVWDTYSKHPDRATPSTVHEQQAYKASLDEFISFVGDNRKDISEITPEITDSFAQNMRESNIAVDTHNRKLRRISRIFETLKEYRDSENPFSTKSLRRKEREEQDNGIRRVAFTREQEEALLKAFDDPKRKLMNKPEIRVVYHLGMFTGQRFKDCVLLRWDKINLDRKRIWVKQFKTGKEVTIPIAPRLLDVLQEAQKWKRDQYVCPNVAERYNKVDAAGKNTGNNLVNIDALRVIRWIGLEPSVDVPGRKKKVTVYGFHSLRHSFASHCAEVGVPKAVVLSILGTNSDIVDKHYTHIGDDAQEKAIMAISGESAVTSDREKINRALAIINNCQKKTKIICRIEAALLNNNS